MQSCQACTHDSLELFSSTGGRICELCYRQYIVKPLVALREAQLKELSVTDNRLRDSLRTLNRAHVNNAGGPFHCASCGDTFPSVSDLTHHWTSCKGESKPKPTPHTTIMGR